MNVINFIFATGEHVITNQLSVSVLNLMAAMKQNWIQQSADHLHLIKYEYLCLNKQQNVSLCSQHFLRLVKQIK